MCAPETTGVKHLYISKYYFVIFPLGSWKSYFQFSILLEEVNLNNITVPSARSARPSYARAPSNVAANNANNANNAKALNDVSESITSQAPAPKIGQQNVQGLRKFTLIDYGIL